MKKNLLVLLISIICLSGCSQDKDNYKYYEHYDLTNYNHKIYTYIRNPNANSKYELGKENYAISVLSPIGQEMLGYTNGLLYEVGENDYILLYSFMGDEEISNGRNYIVMYKDKIYISNISPVITEYTLDRENTKERELTFDVSNILDAETLMYDFTIIKEVDDENIYLESSVSGYNGDTPIADLRNLSLKCSLKDFKCIKNN